MKASRSVSSLLLREALRSGGERPRRTLLTLRDDVLGLHSSKRTRAEFADDGGAETTTWGTGDEDDDEEGEGLSSSSISSFLLGAAAAAVDAPVLAAAGEVERPRTGVGNLHSTGAAELSAAPPAVVVEAGDEDADDGGPPGEGISSDASEPSLWAAFSSHSSFLRTGVDGAVGLVSEKLRLDLRVERRRGGSAACARSWSSGTGMPSSLESVVAAAAALSLDG